MDGGRGEPEGDAALQRLRRRCGGRLDHVRANHYGQNVLIVSSGGPIATAVGRVLGTSPETTIDLNMRHPQYRRHRIRVHAEALLADLLQRDPAPGPPRLRASG